MKIFNKIMIAFLVISFASCELDLTNPNAASEDQVLNTKDGLIALAIGIRQVYSTSVLGSEVLYPSVTTRETAAMTTFSSLEELEDGGSSLASENERIKRLFTRTMRVKGMAENLIGAVDNVDLSKETRAGLLAYGSLFRAKCLGILAQNWEQVPITNSINNDAKFSTRADAYAEAISILESALNAISSNPVPAELAGPFGNIDLGNSINAYLARYNLANGNYSKAIDTADKVDLASISEFTFDSENANPIYAGFFDGTIEYNPRDNFGLPASLTLDPNDGRIAFYVTVTDTTSLRGLDVDLMSCPFFASTTSKVPLYLPGEMMLIKAEAYARSNDISNAEAALNFVRNKLAEDDAFGIGAALPDTYSSGGNMNALLEEIYKNRRAELFLIGTSLEDSRRFGRQEPATDIDYTTERNRNFYPYSADERDSNPNTPVNPTI